jgi:hypothetical protein
MNAKKAGEEMNVASTFSKRLLLLTKENKN